MKTANDWPGVTDTIVTSAGLSEMIRGLSPEQVADLQQRAADLRAGGGPEKIDRTYLRFPDAQGDGHGAPGASLRGILAPGHVTARREFARQWFHAVLTMPRGMAHMAPGVSDTVKRVLAEGSDSGGGYTVPVAMIDELVMDEDPLNQIFPYVRRIPVKTPTGWLPATAVNPSLTWGAENGSTGGGADPEFGNVPWTINRLNALLEMSRELSDDSGIDIVMYVMKLFAQCITSERDRVIAMGSGTGQPMGLYSASGIYDTGITSLTYDNLVKLKYQVDARYHGQRSFRWVFNQRVLQNIIQMTDTIGRPIFQPAQVAGAPPLILGTRYSISNNCPDSFMFCGALEYYAFFDRQQVTIEQSVEAGTAFANHQRWLKVILRFDGRPALPPTTPMARTVVLAGLS